jgi:hypothetical protein
MSLLWTDELVLSYFWEEIFLECTIVGRNCSETTTEHRWSMLLFGSNGTS